MLGDMDLLYMAARDRSLSSTATSSTSLSRSSIESQSSVTSAASITLARSTSLTETTPHDPALRTTASFKDRLPALVRSLSKGLDQFR
eukprot:jgi/Chrzof1/8979/Cz03g31210.t1